jgi:hypothetical protein
VKFKNSPIAPLVNVSIFVATLLLASAKSDADVVELVTGERVKGNIESVAENKLTIKTADGKLRVVPFVDTVEIEFGTAVKPPKANAPQPATPQLNALQPGVPQALPDAEFVPAENGGVTFEADGPYSVDEGQIEPSRSLPPAAATELVPDENGLPPTIDSPQEVAPEAGPVTQELNGERATEPFRSDDVPSYDPAPNEPPATPEVRLASPIETPGFEKPGGQKKSASKNKSRRPRAKSNKPAKKESSNKTTDVKQPIPKAWRVVTYAGGTATGQLKSLSSDAAEITLENESIKQLNIPRVYLRQLTFLPDEQLVANAPENASSDDVVFAKLGDNRTTKVAGKVLKIEKDSVKFSYQGQEKTISLDKIVRIDFGMAAEDAGTLNTTKWPVYQQARVSDTIALPVRLVALDSESISLTSIWGDEVKLPRKSSLRLETRNGRIEYLSAMPANAKQTAYFGRLIPWQNDKTLAKHAIELDGRSFRRGISVHSRTELTYQLDGRFDQFQTYVGFDRLASPQGNVSLQVVVDGDVVFEKAAFRYGDAVEKLDIDVADGKRLTLIVGFGEGQDVGDRIIWADARLVRVKNDSGEK